MRFYKLVDRLRKEGFKVDVNDNGYYVSAFIQKKHLLTRFCSNDFGIPELNNRIAIDNYECSDLWENVPISLPIPNSEYQTKFIITQMRFWCSSDGMYIRSQLIYEKIREYPFYIYDLI